MFSENKKNKIVADNESSEILKILAEKDGESNQNPSEDRFIENKNIEDKFEDLENARRIYVDKDLEYSKFERLRCMFSENLIESSIEKEIKEVREDYIKKQKEYLALKIDEEYGGELTEKQSRELTRFVNITEFAELDKMYTKANTKKFEEKYGEKTVNAVEFLKNKSGLVLELYRKASTIKKIGIGVGLVGVSTIGSATSTLFATGIGVTGILGMRGLAVASAYTGFREIFNSEEKIEDFRYDEHYQNSLFDSDIKLMADKRNEISETQKRAEIFKKALEKDIEEMNQKIYDEYKIDATEKIKAIIATSTVLSATYISINLVIDGLGELYDKYIKDESELINTFTNSTKEVLKLEENNITSDNNESKEITKEDEEIIKEIKDSNLTERSVKLLEDIKNITGDAAEDAMKYIKEVSDDILKSAKEITVDDLKEYAEKIKDNYLESNKEESSEVLKKTYEQGTLEPEERVVKSKTNVELFNPTEEKQFEVINYGDKSNLFIEKSKLQVPKLDFADAIYNKNIVETKLFINEMSNVEKLSTFQITAIKTTDIDSIISGNLSSDYLSKEQLHILQNFIDNNKNVCEPREGEVFANYMTRLTEYEDINFSNLSR